MALGWISNRRAHCWAAFLLCVLWGTGNAQLFRSADYSGQELFERFCSSCHGSEARGDGPVAGSLNVDVPDLTRLALRDGNRFPAFEVREIIDGRALVVAHGPRSMPVWGYEFALEAGGDLEAEREARELIDRLVDYLASIQASGDNSR